MTRSIGVFRHIAMIGIIAGALALPANGEEITVTVPPDDSPQQQQPASPPSAQSLPSFTAGGSLKKPQTSADASTSDAASTPVESPPATTPDKTKHNAKTKKPADTAAISGAPVTTSSTSPAEPATKPADKTKQASKASPCKDLEESACSANKLCSWVVPTPDAAGKVGKARCRSLAMLKKEAAKTAAAAKTAKPEVLPWAAKTTGDAPAAANAAGDAASGTAATTATTPPAKKKLKTASAKKPLKPKETTPPIPASTATQKGLAGQDVAPPASNSPVGDAPAASDAPAADPQ